MESMQGAVRREWNRACVSGGRYGGGSVWVISAFSVGEEEGIKEEKRAGLQSEERDVGYGTVCRHLHRQATRLRAFSLRTYLISEKLAALTWQEARL